MEIKKYNQMMSYLTRKPDKLSKVQKKKIVEDHYKPKSKPPIINYIDTIIRLYSNGGAVEVPEKKQNLLYDIGKKDFRNTNDKDYPEEATPTQMVKLEERFTDKILQRDKYEKPKKKIKKVASSLVSPQKPLPFNLDRWLDQLHPNWWEIEYDQPMVDEEEIVRKKFILENRNKVAEGIETLLSLPKKRQV